MLDILFNALNTWGPLGNLKQVPLGATSPQQWANSSYSIIFGSSTNWVLGFGRSTNILGPDIKVIMDWNEFINFTTKKGDFANSRNFGFASVFGMVGSSDLILGGKNLLNYGDMDMTFVRKKQETVKRELANKTGTVVWPYAWIRLSVGLASFVLIGLNVLARIVNMSQALASDVTTRNLLQSSLQFASSTLEPRLIGLLNAYELLLWIKDDMEKQLRVVAPAVKVVSVTAADIAKATTNLTQSDLVNNQQKSILNLLIDDKRDEINDVKKDTEENANSVVTLLVKALSAAADKAVATSEQSIYRQIRALDVSNVDAALQRNSFRLATDVDISLVASRYDKARVNLSQSNGSWDATMFAAGNARLQGQGNVLIESDQNVSVRISDRGGSHNNLSLNGTNITLQCGNAFTGPSFTMNGADKTLTLQQGGKISPAKIEVKDKSVVISSAHALNVGSVTAKPQEISIRTGDETAFSSLEMTPSKFSFCVNPLVKIIGNEDSIELSVGPSKIIIDATGVVIKGTNVKTQVQMMNELETMIDQKLAKAMSKDQTLVKEHEGP